MTHLSLVSHPTQSDKNNKLAESDLILSHFFVLFICFYVLYFKINGSLKSTEIKTTHFPILFEVKTIKIYSCRNTPLYHAMLATLVIFFQKKIPKRKFWQQFQTNFCYMLWSKLELHQEFFDLWCLFWQPIVTKLKKKKKKPENSTPKFMLPATTEREK